MKIRRQTEAKRPAVTADSSQISVEELLARENAEPIPQRKIRQKLGTAAVIGIEVSIGIVGAGLSSAVISERPYPLHPEQIKHSLESLYFGVGQLTEILECAQPPSVNDISAIVANTHEIVTIQNNDERASGGLLTEQRFEIADRLGLSLVPNETLDDALQKLHDIGMRSEVLSSSEILQQSNDIVNEYLMDNFNLGFEFVPPSDPDSSFDESLYNERLGEFVRNISILPKEAYDNRALWKIIINTNDEALIVAGQPTAAFYSPPNGTITFGAEYINLNDTLVHELWHGYEHVACARPEHIAEVFSTINPPDYQYLDSKWDTGGIVPDRTLSPSVYSQKNPAEDFAESGTNWVFNIDVNDLDLEDLTVAEQKALVAADWANNVAPGLAEYIATVSKKYF